MPRVTQTSPRPAFVSHPEIRTKYPLVLNRADGSAVEILAGGVVPYNLVKLVREADGYYSVTFPLGGTIGESGFSPVGPIYAMAFSPETRFNSLYFSSSTLPLRSPNGILPLAGAPTDAQANPVLVSGGATWSPFRPAGPVVTPWGSGPLVPVQGGDYTSGGYKAPSLPPSGIVLTRYRLRFHPPPHQNAYGQTVDTQDFPPGVGLPVAYYTLQQQSNGLYKVFATYSGRVLPALGQFDPDYAWSPGDDITYLVQSNVYTLWAQVPLRGSPGQDLLSANRRVSGALLAAGVGQHTVRGTACSVHGHLGVLDSRGRCVTRVGVLPRPHMAFTRVLGQIPLVTITVQPGESTSAIARRARVSVQDLVRANRGLRLVWVRGVPVFAHLREGQRLFLPKLRAQQLALATRRLQRSGRLRGAGVGDIGDSCDAGGQPGTIVDDNDTCVANGGGGGGGGGGGNNSGVQPGDVCQDSSGNTSTIGQDFLCIPVGNDFHAPGEGCSTANGEPGHYPLNGAQVCVADPPPSCEPGFSPSGGQCLFDQAGQDCGGGGSWDNQGICQPPSGGGGGGCQNGFSGDPCTFDAQGQPCDPHDGHAGAYDDQGACVSNVNVCADGFSMVSGSCLFDQHGQPCQANNENGTFDDLGFCITGGGVDPCPPGQASLMADPANGCVTKGDPCDPKDPSAVYNENGYCTSQQSICPAGFMPLNPQSTTCIFLKTGQPCDALGVPGTFQEDGSCLANTVCPPGQVTINSAPTAPCIAPGSPCPAGGSASGGEFDDVGFCVDKKSGCGPNEFLDDSVQPPACLCQFGFERQNPADTSSPCVETKETIFLCTDLSALVNGACPDGKAPVPFCPNGTPMPANGICPSCPTGQIQSADGKTCVPFDPTKHFCPNGQPMPASGVCPGGPAPCPGGLKRLANDTCPPTGGGVIVPAGHCPDGLPPEADGSCNRNAPSGGAAPEAASSPWLWILGGAAVLGGGALLLTSSKKKKKGAAASR